MEDSSHELIDQLIAEEKYCYGFENVPVEHLGKENNGKTSNTIPNNPVVLEQEPNSKGKGEKRVSSASSQALLSHNKRWSTEEDELLLQCVKMYGYGKWKLISEHIQTRNALQCKNRARQKKELQEFNTNKRKSSTSSADGQHEAQSFQVDVQVTEASEQPNLIPIPSLLEPDVLAASVNLIPIIPLSEAHVPREPKMETAEGTILELSEAQVMASEEQFTASKERVVTPEKQVVATEERAMAPQEQTVTSQEEGMTPEEEPIEDTYVNPEEITEDEKAANREWFMGKPVKTPERYMRIRNHIIECWKMNKPDYLTKTAGRRNLKDCGDVNAVGRIHGYLESIGAINAGCSFSPIKRKSRRASEDSIENRVSKKLKKGPGYYWADVDSEEDEPEDPRKNIIAGDGKSRPKRTANKRETFYNENRIDYGESTDPFRLIPVVYYPKQQHAPFTVQVTSDVLLVMEFHSHLAYTEIIGLLGGRVVDDQEGKKILQVEYVFPCRSASTGTQCEMDPVSEMAARDLFEQKGLQVVGWYHSHPTFDPEPSIRDIENQGSYQGLFRDEVSGIEPFIGIIISPYNSSSASDTSQFQFIHISNRWSSNHQYRLPFACVHTILQCPQVSPDVLQIFQDLLLQYRTYEHKIDMRLPYGSMTRLEKLLRSLKNHIFMGTEENKKFLLQTNQMIHTTYIGEPIQTVSQDNEFSQNVDKMVDSLAI